MSKWRAQPNGTRFTYRYHQHREKSALRRALNLIAGFAIVILGFPLIPLPGPGWVIIFLGLGLISGEILWIAKFLDFLDRTIVKRTVEFYQNHKLAAILLVTLLAWGFAVLVWLYGPQWQMGPIRWGDTAWAQGEIKDRLGI